MAATPENPIIFYDIVDKNGSYWTVNPYKTRLTLGYKGLPYRMKWVKIEDVEPLMKELGIPPTSNKFPYYTLPMIVDPPSEPNGKPTYVSESFKIAEYLDAKYPAPKYPLVIPPGTHALQQVFVEQYAPSFAYAAMPALLSDVLKVLDEAGKEYMYRTRGGKGTFEPASEEVVVTTLAGTREKWDVLAQTLGEGPWIMGDSPSFADFVIASSLGFWRRMNGSEGRVWKEVAQWQNGKWEDYYNRIQAIEKSPIEVA